MIPINTVQLQASGLFVIKLAAIVLLSLYSFYAFIIVRQVNLMTLTIKLSLKKYIKYVAVFHLFCALTLLSYAIFM